MSAAAAATTQLVPARKKRKKRAHGYQHLLQVLRGYARFGDCVPWQSTLARVMGVCVRTIQRWLTVAQEAGLVVVRRRATGSNRYFLARPKMSRQMSLPFKEESKPESQQQELSKTVETSTVTVVPRDEFREAQRAAALTQIREIAQAAGVTAADAIHAARTAAIKFQLNGFQVAAHLRKAFNCAQREAGRLPRSAGWFYAALKNGATRVGEPKPAAPAVQVAPNVAQWPRDNETIAEWSGKLQAAAAAMRMSR